MQKRGIGINDDTGSVNIIYGSSNGLSSTAIGVGDGQDDQQWHQNSAGIINSNEPGDNFGSSVSVGDFNNDGYDDLAIGVPGEDIGINDDAGSVNIIYGSSNGLSSTAIGVGDGQDDEQWHQNSPGIIDSNEPGDNFGDLS